MLGEEGSFFTLIIGAIVVRRLFEGCHSQSRRSLGCLCDGRGWIRTHEFGDSFPSEPVLCDVSGEFEALLRGVSVPSSRRGLMFGGADTACDVGCLSVSGRGSIWGLSIVGVSETVVAGAATMVVIVRKCRVGRL